MCNLSDLIEKRGEELGKKLGEELGIKSVAIEMLKDGMPVEKVARYAKVSIDTVKRWNDEISLRI